MTATRQLCLPWRIRPGSAHPWVIEAEVINMPGHWVALMELKYRPHAEHVVTAANAHHELVELLGKAEAYLAFEKSKEARKLYRAVRDTPSRAALTAEETQP
jgi:hypothetical protein